MTSKYPAVSDGSGSFEVRLLGKFSLNAADGSPIGLPTQKARALLAMIVLSRTGGIDRATTAGMLWSRGTDAQAKTNLRQTLASVRKALGRQDIIVADGPSLRIRVGSLRSDLDAIDSASFASMRPYIPTLGPLLDGIEIDEPGFADWLTRERVAVQNRVITALFEAAEERMASGAFDDARIANQKLLALDEFDEGAHRQAMRILVMQDNPAKALRHYDAMRDLLRDELNTGPSETTLKLMQSLRVSEDVEPRLAGRARADAVPKAAVAPRDQKTSLAVFPFAQYGDGLGEELGASLAEDLAVELGRFATLSVQLRKEAGQSTDLDPGEGATGYAIKGSIRTSGQRLRITVQLLDVDSGNLVWADRYETKLLDSFDLLEDITQRAVATIPGRVQADVAERATRTCLDELSAHELMLRGKMLRDTLSASAMVEARRILQQAVSLDPSNARAQMYLSDTYVVDGWLGLGDHESSKLALHHANLAVAADNTDVFVQDHLGFAYLSNGRWEDGRAQIQQTLAKIRHEVESNAWCGYALALLGDHDAALREVLDATAKDQMPLATFGWIRGQVLSFNGRFDDAIDELRGASSLNSLALAFLAGAYARSGRSAEASAVLGEFVDLRRTELSSRNLPFGSDSVADLAGGFRTMWRNQKDWQHVASGLALAGLTEG